MVNYPKIIFSRLEGELSPRVQHDWCDTVPHPLSGYISRLFGSFFSQLEEAFPCYLPSVTTLGPLKSFSLLIFSCLLLAFITSRMAWPNNLKKRQEEMQQRDGDIRDKGARGGTIETKVTETPRDHRREGWCKDWERSWREVDSQRRPEGPQRRSCGSCPAVLPESVPAMRAKELRHLLPKSCNLVTVKTWGSWPPRPETQQQ